MRPGRSNEQGSQEVPTENTSGNRNPALPRTCHLSAAIRSRPAYSGPQNDELCIEGTLPKLKLLTQALARVLFTQRA